MGEIVRRIDQSDVRKSLGEITHQPSAADVVFLGQQSHTRTKAARTTPWHRRRTKLSLTNSRFIASTVEATRESSGGRKPTAGIRSRLASSRGSP